MLQIPSSVGTNVFVRAAAIYIFGLLFFFLMCGMTRAQTYSSTSATGAWNTSRWNNSADGPAYTSAYTANNAVSFTSGAYSFVGGMGGAINVGNITVASGVTVTFSSVSGTLQTAGNVRTIDIGSGGLLDFSTQNFSTAAGVGFIKNGAGVLALAGNTYAGGFTLNNGAVVLRGVNAMGAGGSLTLNGGTVAGSATRDLTGKYSSGITIGGDVQFGDEHEHLHCQQHSKPDIHKQHGTWRQHADAHSWQWRHSDIRRCHQQHIRWHHLRDDCWRHRPL